MDHVARLVALGRPMESGGWVAEDFLRAAEEGKRRHVETEELFGIEYQMFRDAITIIEPGFRLAEHEEAAIVSAGIQEGVHYSSRVALYFLKWERCPSTSGLPNPYEPWVEIMEHGGWFQAEHGQLVDVIDSTGARVGFVQVRRA